MRPVRVAHVVDETERCLDALGIGRAHLAGNSMGGWVALELARRGRALSVCALSPAGAWQNGGGEVARRLGALVSLARAARPFLALGGRFAGIRRFAMRDNAAHCAAMRRADFVNLIDDVIGCSVVADLLATTEALSELQVDCPVTLAWAEKDRIFPIAEHGERARRLVPDARFVVLPGVGHVPMLDDPRLVADTIREAAGELAAARAREAHAGSMRVVRPLVPPSSRAQTGDT